MSSVEAEAVRGAPVGQAAAVARTGLQKPAKEGRIEFSHVDPSRPCRTMGATFGWPSAFLALGRHGPLQLVASVCWHTVRRRVEPKSHSSDYQRQGFMASSRHDVIGGNPCSAMTLDNPSKAKDCRLTPWATAS